jgi:hypothetical protein
MAAQHPTYLRIISIAKESASVDQTIVAALLKMEPHPERVLHSYRFYERDDWREIMAKKAPQITGDYFSLRQDLIELSSLELHHPSEILRVLSIVSSQTAGEEIPVAALIRRFSDKAGSAHEYTFYERRDWLATIEAKAPRAKSFYQDLRKRLVQMPSLPAKDATKLFGSLEDLSAHSLRASDNLTNIVEPPALCA